MTAKDLYKVLGVAKDATEQDIKKAYHQMAKKFHPDKNDDANAEEKFKEIGAAYETLKDSSKRRIYDMEREGAAERARMRQQNPPSNSSEPKSSSFSFSRPSGFTFKSSFSTFSDDEFFKRAREEFENMKTNNENTSSKKNKKKKSSKPTPGAKKTFDFTRPEWKNDFNEEPAKPTNEEKPGRNSRHSFPRFSFSDDPFSNIFDKMFEDFFQDTFFTPMFGSSTSRDQFTQSQSKPKAYTPFGSHPNMSADYANMSADYANLFRRMPRRHQPSPNTRKKEDEEEMYNWSKPMFGHKSYDSDSDCDYFDIEDENSRMLMKCTYCGRKFRPTILKKHEQVCQKWQERRQKTPNSDEGPENFRFDSPEQREWSYPGDNLGGMNGHSKAKFERETRSMSPQPSETDSEGYIECRWCHQMFTESEVRKHFPICQERNIPYTSPRNPPMPGQSKTYRAKQYSKGVPKPAPQRTTHKTASDGVGGSRKPPSGASTHTPRAGTNMGGTTQGRTSSTTNVNGNPNENSSKSGVPRSHTPRSASTPRPMSSGSPGQSMGTSSTGAYVPRAGAATSRTNPIPAPSMSTSGNLGSAAAGTTYSSGRSFMEQPYTFTASGLYAHPTGGATRGRTNLRNDLGGSTGSHIGSGIGNSYMPSSHLGSARNVSFTIPKPQSDGMMR